jgi:DNA-binding Lrp family transcriptional regulator
MATALDPLDRQLIELLKVNARLPIVKLAKALGCARSTAQLRLKALEDSGVISGYTVGVTAPQTATGIRAMMLISVTSGSENEVQRALTKRHEIYKLYTVSGRYDFCAMLTTESTQELDAVIDKLRVIKGVADTFSTILLATKLDRPD